MMWRTPKTETDARIMLAIAEACEPTYYNTTDADGKFEHYLDLLLNQDFKNSKITFSLYEDKDAKAVLQIVFDDVEGYKLVRCCAMGFDADEFINWEKATRVIVPEFYRILDSLGAEECVATTPRTKNGKIQIYFIQAYMSDAIIEPVSDGYGWKTTFKRSLRVVSEKVLKVVKTPTLDNYFKGASIIPEGYSTEDLHV